MAKGHVCLQPIVKDWSALSLWLPACCVTHCMHRYYTALLHHPLGIQVWGATERNDHTLVTTSDQLSFTSEPRISFVVSIYKILANKLESSLRVSDPSWSWQHLDATHPNLESVSWSHESFPNINLTLWSINVMMCICTCVPVRILQKKDVRKLS